MHVTNAAGFIFGGKRPPVALNSLNKGVFIFLFCFFVSLRKEISRCHEKCHLAWTTFKWPKFWSFLSIFFIDVFGDL